MRHVMGVSCYNRNTLCACALLKLAGWEGLSIRRHSRFGLGASIAPAFALQGHLRLYRHIMVANDLARETITAVQVALAQFVKLGLGHRLRLTRIEGDAASGAFSI